jgi:AraC-like DNA-binding protein
VPSSRVLCATPVGEIREWVCAGKDTARGDMEVCARWSVVVTRRGAFARGDGSDTQLLAPGAASFWNVGEAYSMTHPVAGGDHCTVFRLNETTVRAMLAENAGEDAVNPRFAIRTRRLDGRAYLLHRRALDAARAEVPDQLEVEEAMAEFLGSAHPKAARESRNLPASSRRLAQAAQAVVAARFREPLTLSEVAREVGCSPFHLTRVMRATIGESLHRHVIRLRLRESLEELLDAPYDIARIALDAGFASHSHMTTAFGREYGITPQAARAKFSRR